MKNRKILAVAVLGLGLSAITYANTARITWVNPTQNTDNSPIPASGQQGSLTGTRIEWGTCFSSGFGTAQGSRTFAAPATSGDITGLNAGQNYCFRGFSINTFGSESAASNVIARLMPAPVPKPPVLSSTVNVVWGYKFKGGKESLEVIGTAPIGTECGNVVIAAAGMYEIDISAVTLDTKLRGARPVTMCG